MPASRPLCSRSRRQDLSDGFKVGRILRYQVLGCEENIDLSKVGVLTKVKLKNMANSAIMEYSLVAEKEADIRKNKISVSSPIGKGLLGKKVGEIAEIQVPRGIMSFEILEISVA